MYSNKRIYPRPWCLARIAMHSIKGTRRVSTMNTQAPVFPRIRMHGLARSFASMSLACEIISWPSGAASIASISRMLLCQAHVPLLVPIALPWQSSLLRVLSFFRDAHRNVGIRKINQPGFLSRQPSPTDGALGLSLSFHVLSALNSPPILAGSKNTSIISPRGGYS